MNTAADKFIPKEQKGLKTNGDHLIGVLSGSGASAGHAIEGEMLQYLQNEYGAIDDHDYPHYVVYNRPIKGFGPSGIEDLDAVKEDFNQALQELDKIMSISKNGRDVKHFIGIACNTLHSILSTIDPLEGEIVNMVDEVAKKAQSIHCQKVLVLASYTTNKMGMYQEYLQKYGIETISIIDEHQGVMDEIIENVMGGKQGSPDIEEINKIIDYYAGKQSFDAVILGCTEIPLAYDQRHTTYPLISSNNTLAVALADKAKNNY